MAQSPQYLSLCQRGAQFLEFHRPDEAEKSLQSAVALDPNCPQAYLLLGFCYANWPGKERKALEVVKRAVALAPDNDDALALHAGVLNDLHHHREALKTAEMALAIDPQNTTALNQQTRALVGLSRWKDVEENSRHTLEVAPHNIFAAQLLALSLQRLGKLEESRTVNAMVLAQIPNNAWAHIQAGWGALRAGDHQDADFHFREALRLDPHIEAARTGLIASLNSRVWLFRVNYQFRDWLEGHHREVQVSLLFGGVALFRVGLLYVHHFDLTWRLWSSVALVFFLFLGYAGNYFANFFLLLDPFARLALTGTEKTHAIGTGLGYLFVLAVFCFYMCWPQAVVLAIPPALFLWAVLLPQIGKKSINTP